MIFKGAFRVGLIPGTDDFFVLIFFYDDDDGGVTRSGMSAANVGASINKVCSSISVDLIAI